MTSIGKNVEIVLGEDSDDCHQNRNTSIKSIKSKSNAGRKDSKSPDILDISELPKPSFRSIIV